MSYIINKYNGEQLIVLEDGTIDTTTSLGLVGRNYVGYGETQNENFVFLLENFSNSLPPYGPIEGQTWYNSETKIFNVYDGESWHPVGAGVVSDIEPENPVEGSLWFKTTTQQLYVYYANRWWLIGPEAVENFETTKAESTTLLDIDNNLNPVILLKVNGLAIGIISSRPFTLSPSNPILGFSEISAGITISSSNEFKGSLNGLATRAERLETARTINGVEFNGQNNITITSNTTKRLIKGSYLLGSDFNGSTDTTWSVDASVDNVIGKVVARDSNGNFSAGTITANLKGDVEGNINVSTGTSNFNVVRANEFIGETLSGNAFSATKLKNARKINGVNFDGTADITVPADANLLTGLTINAGVKYSSLTQLGTLIELNVANNGIVVGQSNELKIYVDGIKSVIKSQVNNREIDFQLTDTSYGDPSPTIAFLPSLVAQSQGGTAVPTFTRIGVGDINLGLPSKRWNSVYANSVVSNTIEVTQLTSPSSNLITANANMIITGNLSVEGTLTSINSTEVVIEDKLLTLASGSSNPLEASGSGIEISGTNTDGETLLENASLTYQSTGAKWLFNRDVDAGNKDFITNGYFRGIATSAQYADLAENYVSDKEYEFGTVLGIGGEKEVSIVDDFSRCVVGIVSKDPAYLMNSQCKGEFVVAIALQGRVPCKVKGDVRKGDFLVSAGDGFARSESNPRIGTVVGKALENFNGDFGIIEVIVTRA
jgi:hypothetical protein